MMGTEPSPTLRARLFVALQHLIPQHGLTRIVYRLTRSRRPALKNTLIRRFLGGFHPDMSDAAERDPFRYATFNEFFTRALLPGARPIDPDPASLVSPVDGTISQIGPLDGQQLVQAKGRSYTLSELLDPSGGGGRAIAGTVGGGAVGGGAGGANAGAGAAGGGGSADWVRRLTGGSFATLYLAPFNYHRIHMPANGTLQGSWYIPGQLFSVNNTTAAAVPRLFARNERVVCTFEDGPVAFAMVLVGALFVGSMTTVWHGDITPRRPRWPLDLPVGEARVSTRLDKGAEMGRFNMGSTVILLLPPGLAQWLPGLRPGNPVRVGQPLAQMLSGSSAPTTPTAPTARRN
ncbi:MAG TPA: archaetidylserine decarboxylase [Steroidobacteraceae bacterium]|nr:archaetidylserine decarboxylase [Steroidobacteraceae bacterium]